MYKIKHYYTTGHIQSDLILENTYVCLFLQEKTGNKNVSYLWVTFAGNMYLFLIIKIEMTF